MLHILLLILKIIGIILLVILGLIIVLLVMILLMPIRYKFNGQYYEEPKVNVYVKWAICFLKVDIVYENSKIKYTVKALGGKILSNDDIKLSWLGRLIKKYMDKGLDVVEDIDDTINVRNTSNTDKKNKEIDPDKEIDSFINENKEDETFVEEENKHLYNDKAEVDKDIEDIEKEYKKLNILDRLKIFVDNIKKIFISIKKVMNSAKTLKEKITIIIDFMKLDTTKSAWSMLKKYIVDILKHIWPRKIEGLVRFGFDDPATTGQVLGLVSLGIPIYKDNITIRPDFEQQIIEGYISGKGRIRIGYLVKIIIKILLDKNILDTITRARKLLGGE